MTQGRCHCRFYIFLPLCYLCQILSSEPWERSINIQPNNIFSALELFTKSCWLVSTKIGEYNIKAKHFLFVFSFQFFLVLLWTSMIQFCEQAWKWCLNRNLVSQTVTQWLTGLITLWGKLQMKLFFIYKLWHFLWWPSALRNRPSLYNSMFEIIFCVKWHRTANNYIEFLCWI